MTAREPIWLRAGRDLCKPSRRVGATDLTKKHIASEMPRDESIFRLIHFDWLHIFYSTIYIHVQVAQSQGLYTTGMQIDALVSEIHTWFRCRATWRRI